MRFQHVMAISLFVGIALVSSACQPKGAVLVKVGNKKITEADLAMLIEANPRLETRTMTPEGKRQLVEKFAEQAMLYQESIRRGVHRKTSVKNKIRLYEKIIIAQALMDDVLEESIEKYYKDNPDEFERIKMAHINVSFKTKEKKGEVKRTENEALALVQQIQQKLSTGGDFAALAKEFSDDMQSKDKGGEIGYVTLGDRRLERHGWKGLVEKGFELQPGTVSEPIKSDNSYHLLKVLEAKSVEPLDEVRPRLEFKLRNQIQQETMVELREKYKIVFPGEEGKSGLAEKTQEPALVPQEAQEAHEHPEGEAHAHEHPQGGNPGEKQIVNKVKE